MKTPKANAGNRVLSTSLIILMIMIMTVPTMSLAAQPTVNLGSTSTYAVLAGSTITNTGTTVIKGSAGGDVGLFPGTAFTGSTSATVSGAIHLADAEASKAKDDLVAAYNDAAGRLPVTRIPTELGGTTLTPGVYDSADGTFQITGTLTLNAEGDPDGVFVFKTASTLITATGSNVLLTDGARYCRTFWGVGTSATLGTNSHFVGHIFAMSSITANTGATVQGQLLARNGAVTLDSNTIINGVCDTDSTPSNPGTTETTEGAITEDGEDTDTTVTPGAIDTPIVTPPTEVTPPITVTTIDGGELPDTASSFYRFLLLGSLLTLVGAFGLKSRKRYE